MIEHRIEHYIEWELPGLFVSRIVTEKLNSRSDLIKKPKNGFAYRIFDISVVVFNNTEHRSEPINKSPKVYYGEVYDVDRVRREVPDNRILIENMECNKVNRVLKCAQGFILIEDDAEVLSTVQEDV